MMLATLLVPTELFCLLSSGPQDAADSPHIAATYLQVTEDDFFVRVVVRAMIILEQSGQFFEPHMPFSIRLGLYVRKRTLYTATTHWLIKVKWKLCNIHICYSIITPITAHI